MTLTLIFDHALPAVIMMYQAREEGFLPHAFPLYAVQFWVEAVSSITHDIAQIGMSSLRFAGGRR